MNSRGEPCGYDDPECRYGAIIDNMFSETVGDEDFAADILTISDWKSAWPTNETELETLQRKGQAVLGWLHYGAGYQGVRQQVVNLRTGVPYSKDIYFDDQGIETLKRWREDILDACAAADLTREARPGAGCLTCRYLTECPDQLAAYSGDGVNRVEQYVALEAVRTSLAKQIRVNTRTESIAVPGGIVGYKIQTKKIPTDGALDELLEHWFPAISEGEPVDIGELRGLLRALDLPASSYEKAAKVLYPDEGNAGFEDMVAACVTTKNESRFGITTTE